MTALPSTEDLARLANAITPAPQAAQEAVPAAWGESYDGGAFFNTVSLTKTKHHTYPLYAHPPQHSASVVEAIAACETVLICAQEMCKAGHPVSAFNVATDALRALKGDA